MTDPSSQEARRQEKIRLIVEEILPFPALPTEHDVWRRNTLFARLADFAAQETAELESRVKGLREQLEFQLRGGSLSMR